MAVSDLFKPLTLLHGPAMSNRFMMAPLTSQQSEFDGTASQYDQFWIEQLAQSGYALIQTSAATVEAGGIAFERQLGIHSDDHLPGLTRMATAIREGGALSAVQLHHAGHRAVPKVGGVPSPASAKTVPGVKALSTEEVERIRDSFIAAAKRAQLAGFDGVSVHGAFGWILSEFLSPQLNDREDKYGGSVENRARFTIEVIEGIRQACGPDFQIGWRLSIERYGLRLEELREITTICVAGSIYLPATIGYFLISRLLFWAALGFIFLYCIKTEHQPLLLWPEKAQGLIKASISIFLILLLIVAGSAALRVIAQVFHWQVESAVVTRLKGYGAVLKLFIVITAAYTEEMLFRGYLMPRLQLFFKGKWLPVILSGLIFGLAHFRYATFVNIAGPVFIGLVFAAYYQKYRNIKVLIICHFIIDFIGLFLSR